MSETFGTIGVLMGGPSAERSISLKSGAAVVEALTARGQHAVPVVLETMDVTAERVQARLQEARADVAFIAMHGTFGEDGTLQDILERLGVPYTGSGPAASRLAFDKWASRERFREHGVPTPWSVRLNRPEAEALRAELTRMHGGPRDTTVVVKPVRQGSSMGIGIVNSAEALVSAIAAALRFDDAILLERCVTGRELTVAIFDEQALPIVEIRPRTTFFDYSAKYQADSTEYLVPAPLEEAITLRVQQTALTAHRALGCRHFSRVDIILTPEGTPVVLEVNTIPGLTGRSLLPMAAQACGCSFADLCAHMVALALELESRPAAVMRGA